MNEEDLMTIAFTHVLDAAEILRLGDVVKVEDLQKMAREWVKELRRQEKLHWKAVSNSIIGENPSCKTPRGFSGMSSLPGGYEAQIEVLQKVFNLKEVKK